MSWSCSIILGYDKKAVGYYSGINAASRRRPLVGGFLLRPVGLWLSQCSCMVVVLSVPARCSLSGPPDPPQHCPTDALLHSSPSPGPGGASEAPPPLQGGSTLADDSPQTPPTHPASLCQVIRASPRGPRHITRHLN